MAVLEERLRPILKTYYYLIGLILTAFASGLISLIIKK